jgi:phosphoglycerate dehydrogenase-like enzyme
MIQIWKNTKTLDGYDEGLIFTENKKEADIILSGSKNIQLKDFPNLKAIFRAGIGKDNIPETEAKKRDIIIRLPSIDIIEIIFEETANFTCQLIFKMNYFDVGNLDKWEKYNRDYLGNKNLLVIGMGNIGKRVFERMKSFMNVNSFDTLTDDKNSLDDLIKTSDFITLHIPNTKENKNFFNYEKMQLMKKNSTLINTARGNIVNEDSLYEYIKEKKIKAAFDVFWSEPYNGKLTEFYPDNFYMTPHIASTCADFLSGCRRDLNKLIEEITK